MSSMSRRAAAAVLMAVGLGSAVGAQGVYNAIGSGGPLWWFPENDTSYSRHHDRYYMSHVEALNGDWGAATSFPTVAGEQVWVSDISGAPPNSACDVRNGVELVNVGPLYPNDGVLPPRTSRTPDGVIHAGGVTPRGGFAGLQMSLHIGEWWQGLKYRGYWDDARAAVEHFGSRPGFSPQLFGWFDVGMRDGAGTVARPPLFGSVSVDWIHPVRSQWQLHGGGGFTMPCLGVSMVKMHGVEGGGAGQVWPPLPVGADGGECWSSARPLVLRVNTEARCEPDLSVRPADYDPVPFTAAFWSRFDAAAPRPAPAWIGGEHLPLFPYATYRGARARYPYIMMRRGEFAVFTVDELASATPPAVPWSNLSYPVAGAAAGGTRPALSARFLDPDRVDPFGGAAYGAGTVDLYNSDLNAIECVELGEPGWDAVSGTLRVDCAHGRENSPNTGRVNRAEMGHGTRQRSREVGPVDNSRSYGGRAVARRSAGLWTPPAGFGWFEHRNATLGCVFFRANTRGDHLVRRAEYFREQRLHMMGRSYRSWLAASERLARCTDDRCRATERANVAVARFWGLRYFREAYGWEIIRDYREWAAREMERALRSARYPYRIESARRLVANGRVLGDGGNACITNLGPGRYTEALIPSYPTFESSGGRTAWASQASIPGQGGRMWYGAAFGAYGAHAAGQAGDHYTQFADVAGRTTSYSESVINPGSQYPEELRRYGNYNDVRMGSSVWRDFACKTAHGGYYGMGLTAVGPTTADHRENPARAWLLPDSRIAVGDMTATQYSSGTPCVADPAYDARGADGTRRCFDPVAGLGAYSTPAHPSGDAASYRLEYSGDGSSDAGRPGAVDAMRPTSYRLVDGSELFDVWVDSDLATYYGWSSLDLERERIWFGYGPLHRSWLRSGESYAGVAPGWAGSDQTAVPLDWGRLEHQGPVRWYGAMVIGGTGGCTLDVEGGVGVDGKPPQASVLESGQRIVCLLPVDAVPDGRCPGENLP